MASSEPYHIFSRGTAAYENARRYRTRRLLVVASLNAVLKGQRSLCPSTISSPIINVRALYGTFSPSSFRVTKREVFFPPVH